MNREELLPKEVLDKIPPLYTYEETSANDIVIQVKYFLVSFTWLVAECEVQGDDVMFYGYVINHTTPEFSEWGSFTLRQLMEVKLPGGLGVERDLYFDAVKFGECKEEEG